MNVQKNLWRKNEEWPVIFARSWYIIVWISILSFSLFLKCHFSRHLTWMLLYAEDREKTHTPIQNIESANGSIHSVILITGIRLKRFPVKNFYHLQWNLCGEMNFFRKLSFNIRAAVNSWGYTIFPCFFHFMSFSFSFHSFAPLHTHTRANTNTHFFTRWENVVHILLVRLFSLWVRTPHYTISIFHSRYLQHALFFTLRWHFSTFKVQFCSLRLHWVLLFLLLLMLFSYTLRLVACSSHKNSLRHLLSMLMNGKHGNGEIRNTLKWVYMYILIEWTIEMRQKDEKKERERVKE